MYALDGSRICYAVYAMSSGMHYCLVVEEALNVLDTLCNNFLALLQKPARTNNTPNITTEKTSRIFDITLSQMPLRKR